MESELFLGTNIDQHLSEIKSKILVDASIRYCRYFNVLNISFN